MSLSVIFQKIIYLYIYIYIYIYRSYAEEFIARKIYMMTSYSLLMTFLLMENKYCNTGRRCIWTVRGTVLKNESNLVISYMRILPDAYEYFSWPSCMNKGRSKVSKSLPDFRSVAHLSYSCGPLLNRNWNTYLD